MESKEEAEISTLFFGRIKPRCATMNLCEHPSLMFKLREGMNCNLFSICYFEKSSVKETALNDGTYEQNKILFKLCKSMIQFFENRNPQSMSILHSHIRGPIQMTDRGPF